MFEKRISTAASTAQKRGPGVAKTKRGKGSKLMAIADRHGFPLRICVGSASSHEVTLVEGTLDNLVVDEAPEKLIGDKAYDSDPFDARLERERAIELIAPHKSNRRKLPTQDGRKLRRYRNRWRIERLSALLQSFRRLVSHYEYHLANFLGFARLACMLIALRQF
ncbi:MAG: IS5 family transposase [Gammaproteobacteria bacterium]|nr:IS5 family transposase [Gammaproteobacteria bacterium]